MRRKILIVLGSIAVLFVTFHLGMFWESLTGQEKIDNIVAVAWGDGSVGPAFYGALSNLCLLAQATLSMRTLRLVEEIGFIEIAESSVESGPPKTQWRVGERLNGVKTAFILEAEPIRISYLKKMFRYIDEERTA